MTVSPATKSPRDASRRHPRFHVPFSAQILLGLIIGVALGLWAAAIGPTAGTDPAEAPNWLTATLGTVGTSFVTLLKVLVPPTIFLAVVSSITKLRGVTNAASLAWRTLLWFAITALIAVTIGIVLGLIFQPGTGENLAVSEATEPSRTGGWFDFLKGLIPANFLGLSVSVTDSGAVVGFNVLQILVISVVTGIAALKVGAVAQPFIAVVDSLLEIVQKALWWVLRLAPIGTAGLLGYAVVAYGWSTLSGLGTFIIAFLVGIFAVGLIVYPALVKLHGLSIRSYFSGVWPAVLLGFTTRSSIGTLPVTRAVTIENFGVPKAYASFAVPLGVTTKMDGCAAIYPAIATIFVANFYGVPLDVQDYLLIAVVSVLGSAATTGLTGATVITTLMLSTLGLPLEGLGLLLAVDPIVDMFRTALNVAGQALVPAIVSKRDGSLDVEVFNGPNAFDGRLDDNTPANTDGATAIDSADGADAEPDAASETDAASELAPHASR